MDHFVYRDGVLHAEDVPLPAIAAAVGTPVYVYSRATLERHARVFKAALADLPRVHIAFAIKANPNLAVLKVMQREGLGADVVSGGELDRALAAGMPAADIVFSGVGKTARELVRGLEAGIGQFNIESEEEGLELAALAAARGIRAACALRVNPDVDAGTHDKISTGKAENKFGIDFEFIPEVYQRAAALPNIRLRGIQMHIGSQLTLIQPFIEAVEKVAPLAAMLRERHGIEFWSIGGGIGIVYDPALASGSPDWWADRPAGERPLTIEQYAAGLVPLLRGLGLKILLEPGRYLVGNAGVLLTRCLYEKHGRAKTFKVVDAGMNDLIRPALYESHHEIVPLREPGPARKIVDVVGPICETGDFFCQDRELPDFEPGETVALMSAGAYGFVMASNYNSRPLPAEVLVDGDHATLVRRRQTLEELIAPEL
jgi:diaminopimelate decarboxylase